MMRSIPDPSLARFDPEIERILLHLKQAWRWLAFGGGEKVLANSPTISEVDSKSSFEKGTVYSSTDTTNNSSIDLGTNTMAAPSKGSLTKYRTAEKAWQLISDLAESTLHARQRSNHPRTVNEVSSSGENATLTKTLCEMTSILKQLQINQQQPPPPQHQQSQQLVPQRICGICSCYSHYTDECPISKKITPWRLPITSMTALSMITLVKDTIHKTVIPTKGTPNKEAITIKGVTTIIKVG
ncbi:hypothetical protein AHAS_Ahas19G0200300 [Arachis hypogaea]